MAPKAKTTSTPWHRLANGMGSIRKLSGNRTRPYAVYAPAHESPDGYKYDSPIAYTTTREAGQAVLLSLRLGQPVTPESVAKIEQCIGNLALSPELLSSDLAKALNLSKIAGGRGKTFKDVYEEFFDAKFGSNRVKDLSASAETAYRTGFAKLEPIHNLPVKEITTDQLQAIINKVAETFGKGTIANIIKTLHGVYKYAMQRDIVIKDVSQYVVTPGKAKEDEHGVPFTMDELEQIWQDKADPTSELLCILCLSGFRIGELNVVAIDLDQGVFRGGLKTKDSRNRTVPIHSAIRPLVEARLERYNGKLLPIDADTYRRHLRKRLKHLGIEKAITPEGKETVHTPHDARHTFRMLAEHYKVPENDIRRLLGHVVGKDVDTRIYAHRSVSDLRESIELIKFPFA